MCRLQSGVAPDTPILYSPFRFIVQEAPLKKISFCVGGRPLGWQALMTGVAIWTTGEALAKPANMLK